MTRKRLNAKPISSLSTSICKVKFSTYIEVNDLYSRETYKYFSAVDPAGLIMCIGVNTYTEIISNCSGFIDGKTFKMSDLDLEFVATNAG